MRSGIKLAVVAAGVVALAAVAIAQFAAPATPLFGWSHSAASAEMTANTADDADPARLTALAIDALVTQPIAAEPLIVAALAKAGPDPVGALALMVEARRRHPRMPVVRAWLADHYVREGDYRLALAEINRLVALRPDLAREMDPVLLATARTPEGWREVNRAVADDPAWKSSFVTNLLKRSDAEAENAAFSLVARGGPGDDPQDRLRRSLLLRLVNRGEYDRAYLAWFNFLPESAMAETGLVYDPRFRRLPGLPPFNWAMPATDEGLAEYAPDGGLDLRFYGRANAALVNQTMMLPPARYALAIAARSPAGDTEATAQIVYRLQCAGSRAVLAQGPLSALGSAAKRYGGAFTVPDQACPAQILTISGVAGDATRETSAHIESITIAAVQP